MAYGGKKYLAHDSVFMKAQQTGVFMINTILFPIHKPDLKKNYLSVSLENLLRLQLQFIICNDKFTSPQVFSTRFWEVNNIEISMPLSLFHKIFGSYC